MADKVVLPIPNLIMPQCPFILSTELLPYNDFVALTIIANTLPLEACKSKEESESLFTTCFKNFVQPPF